MIAVSMSSSIRELTGLRVTIDKVLYQPNPHGSAEHPHIFIYFITIHNDSDETVTIKGRKWVVTDDEGRQTVVEGDGVVGECPRLEPGEKFDYNSSHGAVTNSVAEGAYFGVNDAGERVLTRIPAFELRVPWRGR